MPGRRLMHSWPHLWSDFLFCRGRKIRVIVIVHLTAALRTALTESQARVSLPPGNTCWAAANYDNELVVPVPAAASQFPEPGPIQP